MVRHRFGQVDNHFHPNVGLSHFSGRPLHSKSGMFLFFFNEKHENRRHVEFGCFIPPSQEVRCPSADPPSDCLRQVCKRGTPTFCNAWPSAAAEPPSGHELQVPASQKGEKDKKPRARKTPFSLLSQDAHATERVGEWGGHSRRLNSRKRFRFGLCKQSQGLKGSWNRLGCTWLAVRVGLGIVAVGQSLAWK